MVTPRDSEGRMPTTVNPQGYLKKVMGGQEQILYVVRVHGLFFLLHNFLWLLLTLVVFGVATGLQFTAMGNAKMMFIYLLMIAPLAPVWWSYLQWRNHQFVVTNRRVVQIKGVLGKEVVDASLDQINDVRTDQSLFGRMFNFGDVEVVTASAILTDEMHNIAKPLEFKRALLDAKEGLLHATHSTAS
jgi:uncharacterized membrane protein YdbT with pleckstrin-like domain